MRKVFRVAAGAWLAALPVVPGVAQNGTNLDEVIVTANKFPQKQAQTGKTLTVLGDSVLRANSGKTLTDLLNQQVGLQVLGSQQPLGSVQGVYLRGAGTGYTLILLDGVPVYDPSGIEGGFDLNFIPLDQLARVEILKGGQSTLYGSDAVAGVINLITKPVSDKKAALSGLLSGGSYGTFRGNVGLNGSLGKTGYQVQYSTARSRGFSAAYDPTERGGFDNDGFRQQALRLGLSRSLGENLTLRLSGLYSTYRADLDAGAFRDDKDFTATNATRQLAAGLEYALKRGKVFVNYHVNGNERHYLDDSTSVPKGASVSFSDARYAARSHFAEAYTTLNPAEAVELVAGLDFRAQNTDQSYRSVGTYGPYETPPLSRDFAHVRIASAFASAVWKRETGPGLEAGGRFNYHSVYGPNATYTVNPFYRFGARAKAFGTVSSSFKAPSLYYLYSPYGNLDLKPETATNLEAGVQVFGKTPKQYLRAVYFNRRLRDVVFFQSLPKAPYGKYVNLNRQHDQGLELDGAWSVGQWQVSANYTFLTGQITARQASGRDTTYNNLLRRPRHAFNATVGFAASRKWTLSASVRSVSSRPDAFFNEETFRTDQVTLAAFTTVDVYAEYRLNSRLRLFADLRNLTNAQYFDVYGFNNRRFNGTGGVVLSW
jgi:vitamin B12 transporter